MKYIDILLAKGHTVPTAHFCVSLLLQHTTTDVFINGFRFLFIFFIDTTLLVGL